MNLSWAEIKYNAQMFSAKWRNAIDESAEAQSFLNDFFNVFGIDRLRVALFEKKVPKGKDENGKDRNGYIDLLWKGVILVEMKSKGKSLDKAYDQAKDYAFNLDDEELPEYIMVCDFENIRLYRNVTGQVWNFKTSQLYKNIKLFADLMGKKTSNLKPVDKDVDIKAAEKMAKLHDILKSHGYKGHQLELYLVRILFCLFADDTEIFEKNIFFDYISNSKEDGSDLSYRIARLFEILDTSPEERVKQTMISEELKRFEYINGSLFREKLPFADYDYKMRKILLDCSSFNWTNISPAIFGAMFQGVMNPQERRKLGAHYTSEENILKLIKPLFLDDLWKEFELIKFNKIKLNKFHDRLSNLKFFDPACGCGNFLIIAYKEIRRLELEVMKMLLEGQKVIDISSYCKVDVNQFYGIEYEEFPCQIAHVGMWLIDHQMNNLVSEYFGLNYARLPLKQSATIVHGNALTIDWDSIVPKNELSFILGNPPFVGTKYANKNQKEDLKYIFKNNKKSGLLDYVSAWYMKAAKYIKNTNIKVAFVSTNSITQGEQVAVLWEDLFIKYNTSIDFAYKTFKWTNDAKGQAAVHCVIIGFSFKTSGRQKLIFENDGTKIIANNINPYLIDAPNIWLKKRLKPICDVPNMIKGSQPTDGGYLILNDEEKKEIILNEPMSERYIRPYMGANDFINNDSRWCLWLLKCPPNELKNMPMVLDRLEKVKQSRLNSSKKITKDKANTPMLFTEIRQPMIDYLLVPVVSSSRRNYIPMGFVKSDVIANTNAQMIPGAQLYHFGILTSSVHMSWVKTICGRMKSDFAYSSSIVYNNFPWPNPTEKQKEAIEMAAQGILDIRATYSDTSLADLYTPLIMPHELVKAHSSLDKAVIAAYGVKSSKTEIEIISILMQRYQKLVKLKDA